MRELPECLSRFAFLVLRFLKLLQEPGTGVDAVLDAALAPHVSLPFYPGEISSCSNKWCASIGYVLTLTRIISRCCFQEESGKYFFGGKGKTIGSSGLSYDTELAKKLWAESSAVFKELQLRGGDFRNT
jgi:hypothetical protein